MVEVLQRYPLHNITDLYVNVILQYHYRQEKPFGMERHKHTHTLGLFYGFYLILVTYEQNGQKKNKLARIRFFEDLVRNILTNFNLMK